LFKKQKLGYTRLKFLPVTLYRSETWSLALREVDVANVNDFSSFNGSPVSSSTLSVTCAELQKKNRIITTSK
jgi:hypothetical protein